MMPGDFTKDQVAFTIYRIFCVDMGGPDEPVLFSETAKEYLELHPEIIQLDAYDIAALLADRGYGIKPGDMGLSIEKWR